MNVAILPARCLRSGGGPIYRAIFARPNNTSSRANQLRSLRPRPRPIPQTPASSAAKRKTAQPANFRDRSVCFSALPPATFSICANSFSIARGEGAPRSFVYVNGCRAFLDDEIISSSQFGYLPLVHARHEGFPREEAFRLHTREAGSRQDQTPPDFHSPSWPASVHPGSYKQLRQALSCMKHPRLDGVFGYAENFSDFLDSLAVVVN